MRKLNQYKNFKIYQATKKDENNGYIYAAYLKDTSPLLDDPEWQSDNSAEIIDFIDSRSLNNL